MIKLSRARVVELSMVVSRLWWKKSKFFFLQLLVETFFGVVMLMSAALAYAESVI